MKLIIRVFTASAAFLIITAGTMVLSGCGGSSGGGGSSGKTPSTLIGTVNSFSGGTAFFMAVDPPSLARQIFEGFLDLLVSEAHAGVGGLTVHVSGTDLSTTTGDDGFFVISGVPPGSRNLEFTLGEDRASLGVDVPPNSNVNLNNINISGNGVSVGSVTTENLGDDSSDGFSDDPSYDGVPSTDDSGSDGPDDNGTGDDDGPDHDANDDHGGDDDDDDDDGGNSGKG